MPRSKKGRLSGDARKEINSTRIADIFRLLADIQRGRKKATEVDFVFARVVKALGANHVRVAIDGRHGPFEIIARIPNIYSRRGATPVTTRSVVTIYTGTGFDAKTYEPTPSDQFDITSILSLKDTQKLRDAGHLPEWMLREVDSLHVAAGDAEEGFEFDYTGGAGDDDEEDDDDDDEDDDSDSEEKPVAAVGGGSAAAMPGAAELAEAEAQKKAYARAARSRDVGRAAARGRVEARERDGDDIDIDAL